MARKLQEDVMAGPGEPSCVNGHSKVERGPDGRCRACRRNRARKYRAENPEHYLTLQRRRRASEHGVSKSRAYRIFYRYGITVEQLEEMKKKQKGRCAICKKKRDLKIDHCHKVGEVRKLLCDNCNKGIGNFFDDAELLREAARYVEEHQKRKKRVVVVRKKNYTGDVTRTIQ